MTENETHTPIPPLSEGTTAAIANLVDYTIEREYGHDVAGEIRGAQMVAQAGLRLDLRAQFIATNGSDRGLTSYAETTLRILVRDGLAARVCQCRQIHGVCPHPSTPGGLPCANHYEADVPAINGMLLCGSCHIDEYQSATAVQ